MNSKSKLIIIICIGFTFLLHATDPKRKIAWEVDFSDNGKDGKPSLPKGWEIHGQFSVNKTDFSVLKHDKITYLSVKSDDSTGTMICQLTKVNLNKTPILTWKWRANKLPDNGDGRERKTDDQACGIYVGTGNILSKKSISYRWDTNTPKGTEGEISYAMGSIKVKWITLENKDSGLGKWLVEKRNIAEDFKKAWGFVPSEAYLSICGNSQHSKSKGIVDIDWIKIIEKSGKE